MMSSVIRILDEHTINKIAAGEVIENPSSVIKELIENAIDAGSTEIYVEIQEGGRQLIRVSDNGCGMTKEDALLSLERHATSKIKDVEDIEELLTMGFRGEAIPSIAAISKFSLLTSPRNKEQEEKNKGTIVIVEGGKILSCASAVRSPGTTIEVKSLFFNVPVRRKFQKSPLYDTQEIVKLLQILSLANPLVQFELIGDQKILFKTQSQATELSNEILKKRMENVLGKEISNSMLPLNFRHDPYVIEGFIGLPNMHRANRTGQYLFINQRPVFSPMVSAAVRDAFGPMLPSLRFPFFILHLHMPGSFFDVNVHPQKKEVRLRQELQLKETIMQAVQEALRKEQSQKEVAFLPLKEEIEVSHTPFYYSDRDKFKNPIISEEKWEYKTNDYFSPSEDKNTVSVENSSFHAPSPAYVENFPLFNAVKETNRAPRVITTIMGFIILDPYNLDSKLFPKNETAIEGGLALVDQHAAYARIYYEKLLKKKVTDEIQNLLLPITLQLSKDESLCVNQILPSLNKMGISIREFGEHTFLIDSLPVFFKLSRIEKTVHSIIQEFMEMQTTKRLQLEKEEQLALIASRSSIPSVKQLSMDEAQALINQLITCDFPGQCPLGKPVCLYFSQEEMKKWFR